MGRLELHVDRALGRRPAVCPPPRSCVGVVDVGQRLEPAHHRQRPPFRLGEGRARGRPDRDLVLAAVEVGHEVAAQDREDREARGKEGRHREDGGAVPQRPAQQPLVLHVQVVEPVVEALQRAADEVGVVAPLDVGVHPARGQHRVEREAHEERGEHRRRHRDPELVEEAADHAAHEGDRHEYRDDREGGGRHREADLGGAVAGGSCGPGRAAGGARCSRARRSHRRSACRSRARGPSA